MRSLKGKVAIITARAAALAVIAVKLAQCGADVTLVDLEAPAESAALAGPSAIPFAADVSSEAAWAKLGEAIDRTFDRVDIIVNNAAGSPPAGFRLKPFSASFPSYGRYSPREFQWSQSQQQMKGLPRSSMAIDHDYWLNDTPGTVG
jgi:NAD(P)-dependent dehydrogenase (short-subunit alcohol dehydrogenase family)